MDRRAEVRSIVVMRGIPCRAYRELGHQPTVIRAAMMETDYANAAIPHMMAILQACSSCRTNPK
jgi:hypothetical protein